LNEGSDVDVSDEPPWPLSRVWSGGRGPDPVRLVALAGDVIVVATDAALHVTAVGSAAGPRPVAGLDWSPRDLAVSPSGRFALVTSPRRHQADVIDLRTGERVVSASSIGQPSPLVRAAFATLAGSDVLVVSRRLHVLEVLALPSGESLGEATYTWTMAFIFTSLHPMLDGDTMLAIGYGYAESKDSLMTISLREVIDDPLAAAAEFTKRTRASDYAYQLTAGPCGRSAMVAYRNPEDDEEPGPDDEPDEPDGDLDNLQGLYVRRFSDLRLLEHIADDHPVESGAPLFATDTAVVLSRPGQVEIVPRAAAERSTPTTLEAPIHAFDPEAARIVVVKPDATIQVLQITVARCRS